MTREIQIEMSMLAWAFALGICLRLVFHGAELLRKLCFRGRIASACLDILYWMLASAAVYGLMYRYASGTLRGIILLFTLSGLVFMTAIDRRIGRKIKKHVKNC
ncbi:MAG: spore cortex biosynthesis protein YabQ [Lachnospiraceae bacterium]|nr:spore cortex biosynthesis protein YabQ [Lachnospiraceae bacterium]